MPLTYPHPPTRAAFETAVANLARLGGPTPPNTISVGPRPGDGKPQGDVEGNPEFDAYRQAQHTWQRRPRAGGRQPDVRRRHGRSRLVVPF